MTLLIDSHCHPHLLDLSAHEGGLDFVMQHAKTQDVRAMLCVAVSLQEMPEMIALANRYPQIFLSVGIHPNEDSETTLDHLCALAGSHPNIIAIGETGLDYYRITPEAIANQQARFRLHIQAAKITKKPLIIHMRDADEDTLRIMAEEDAAAIGGVMHCFTSTHETAKRAMAMGFYISISGIVTFKNATALQAVAKEIPDDFLLIETDAPYLAPVPYRGKQNLPGYVRETALFLAQLRGQNFEKLAETTTHNFRRLFNVTANIA